MDWSIIGLNDYEGRVMEALLKTGESNIARVSRNSGVPRSKTYEVLDSLMMKGLVEKTNTKPLRYSAEASKPRINQLIGEKTADLKRLKKGVKELDKLEKTKKNIRIYEGKRNWYRALRLRNEVIIEPGNHFNYSVRFNFEIHPEYGRKSKGADTKDLGPINTKTIQNVERLKKRGDEIRHFDNDKVAISITNMGIVIGLVDSNSTLVVTDKYFTKTMKNLFLKAWEGVKK